MDNHAHSFWKLTLASSTTAASILAVLVFLMACATQKPLSNAGAPFARARSQVALSGTNRIHYSTLGAGSKTILFVHGWAGNGTFWREQIAALSGKARLIFIDLPGHGRSDKPHTDYSMEYFGRAVVAVLQHGKVDKATLVGHSMGVPVLCQVYKQAPQKVAALVAVDGLLRRPMITAEQANQFIAPFRGTNYRDHVSQFIRSMFPHPQSEQLREEVLADMLRAPQHVMLGAMEGMFGPGQPGWDLRQVEVPIIVINAENPMWTPEYEAYARSLSSQVTYRTIQGAGHFLMLEKPAEFNALLLESLEQYGLLSN